jgi:hypothetical protein
LAIAPAGPTGGLFAALRARLSKNLGFTAIRAMLRDRNEHKSLKNQCDLAGVTQFCGFSSVNMI